jgi:hypothetical protein
VASIVELPDAVSISDHLTDGLNALESTPGAIPVLDDDHANLVGWLSHQRVLSILRGFSDDAQATGPTSSKSAPGSAARQQSTRSSTREALRP